MQTFLPIPSFAESARVLDRQRLGKQRVEALQILRALRGQTKGWVKHPAVKMWRGYEEALETYLATIDDEWVRRGYKSNIVAPPADPGAVMPPWFGDAAFHASHRSNLLRKDPVYYAQFGWTEPHDMAYVWPV